ncbi:hypothetical protein ACOZZ4_003415 [Cronobacter dublinensis]|uniref:hypothetical protein n=1 Tax=Cronobacter dublinensis TaxID=413497 RepID=UPI0013760E0A|nr:hypothetical protein [Cronobacter dublinensis]EKY3086989.1 hypothetical protein [Cronobacter dublinensis]ELQ6227778.1 hypothetical protein [Cronobacter dublinensis]ELY4005977.1 hypothetical protein [Cronobacter dublinensis]ELY4407736.1 hypothetical protein [Cronobacter dublinensis]ELY5817388.1 hypothetical protein [Cronobacter dublinensis]
MRRLAIFSGACLFFVLFQWVIFKAKSKWFDGGRECFDVNVLTLCGVSDSALSKKAAVYAVFSRQGVSARQRAVAGSIHEMNMISPPQHGFNQNSAHAGGVNG